MPLSETLLNALSHLIGVLLYRMGGDNCNPLGCELIRRSCSQRSRGDIIPRTWFDGSGRPITIT
jgi:hypothetical protein